MNREDDAFAALAARNPIPDPEALSAEERADAEAIRTHILATAPATRPAPVARRRARNGLALAGGLVPVLAVVLIALSLHGTRHNTPAATTGKPQTVLIVGSTEPLKPLGGAGRYGVTDTILLVRLFGNGTPANVVAVPRDLKVHEPGAGGHTASLSQIVATGGVPRLEQVLRSQVFPGLTIDHQLLISDSALPKVVNALGCVYGDVDHRYKLGPVVDETAIDLEPGLQRMCGTAALAYARFRHADSDFARSGRDIELLSWIAAALQGGGDHATVERVINQTVLTDHALAKPGALTALLREFAAESVPGMNQIAFPYRLPACGPQVCYVTATRQDVATVHRALFTPGAVPPVSRTEGGVVSDPVDGHAQARAVGAAGLPVMYPRRIAPRSQYCSSATGNCDETKDTGVGAAAYTGAYPRRYALSVGGHRYTGYRLTLDINPLLDEYYGVEGTTWRNPPELSAPQRTLQVHGRMLLEFFSGQHLMRIGWRTAHGAYWVSNTLAGTLSNAQMLAIADSTAP